jgi:hypothetical protein
MAAVDVEVSIGVEAPAATVWALMADYAAWPSWTDSVDRAEWLDEPTMAVGARARVKQPGLPASVWIVTEVIDGRSFTAESSSMGVTSVAGHAIEGPPEGPVTVHLSLSMTGPLAGVVGRLGGSKVRRLVEMEAAGLKQHSEQAAASG